MASKRRRQQLGVMHIGAGDHHRQRPARRLDQQAALHPALAAIGGIAAEEVPPSRALPIAPSAACHSQSTPPNSSQRSTSVPRGARRGPGAPSAGRCDAPNSRRGTARATGSIGSRCASERGSHPASGGHPPAGVPSAWAGSTSARIGAMTLPQLVRDRPDRRQLIPVGPHLPWSSHGAPPRLRRLLSRSLPHRQPVLR